MKNIKIQSTVKVKNKIIIGLTGVLLGVFALFTVVSAQSAGLLQIDFQNGNGNPLFDEANFLPGDAVVRYVDVLNLSDSKQAVVVKIENVIDFNDLALEMEIEIDDDLDPNTSAIYKSSILDLFGLENLHLIDLEPQSDVRLYFSVTLNINATNEIQEKNMFFDIVVGEGALESFSSESDSGSTSGGTSFVYNGLEITNVAVVTTSNTATVSWDTNKNATSRLVYDTVSRQDLIGASSPNYGYAFSTILLHAPADTNGVISHSIVLIGLNSNTVYFFRPISSASPEKTGNELFFRTGSAKAAAPKLVLAKRAASGGYSLTIKNTGNETAQNVSVQDSLAGGQIFAEDKSQKKTWALGDIAPGEYKSLSYVVRDSENGNLHDEMGEIKVLAYNYEPITHVYSSESGKMSLLAYYKIVGVFLIALFIFIWLYYFVRKNSKTANK